MPQMPRDNVSRSATRTMTGEASVRITHRCSTPEHWPDGLNTGVIDFEKDLCSLEGTMGHLILSSAQNYELIEDGRWRMASGRDGQRGMFDPRLLLELLEARKTGQVRQLDDKTYLVELDHAIRSDAQITPISSDWNLTAEVAVDGDGSISQITERYVNRDDPDSWIEVLFVFSRLTEPVEIDVPPIDQVITEEAYLAELGYLPQTKISALSQAARRCPHPDAPSRRQARAGGQDFPQAGASVRPGPRACSSLPPWHRVPRRSRLSLLWRPPSESVRSPPRPWLRWTECRHGSWLRAVPGYW